MMDDAIMLVTPVAADVVEYFSNDDPNYYQNHVFLMHVWVEQNMYKIQRSYAAFVELDYKLRYQYPRSQLPALPLAGGYSTVKKAPARRFSTSTIPSDGNLVSTSTGQEKIARKMLKRKDPNEVINNKCGALTQYLKDLLRIPEILVSELLIAFLDEESNDGAEVEEFSEDMIEKMEINILLQDDEVTTRTVWKDFKLPFEVAEDTVLLWSFSTVNHNIGFSVSYNDVEVVAYQRYNAHERSVRGCLEVPVAGQVTLIWDNTFSKWRSKTLNFQFKAITAERYEDARQRASELKSRKIAYYKQRVVLKKAMAKLSAELLVTLNPSKSIIGMGRMTMSSSLPQDFINEIDSAALRYHTEDQMDIKAMLKEIEVLQQERQLLKQTLSESEALLSQERSAGAESMRTLEKVCTLKEGLEEELSEVKNELEAVKGDFGVYIKRQEEILGRGRLYPPEDILDLPEEILSDAATAVANFLNLVKYTKKVQKDLEEQKVIVAAQEQILSKLKAEKKQLKTYAIQSKEKIEMLEGQVGTLEHEKTLMSTEGAQLRERIEVLVRTVAQLQEAATEGGREGEYSTFTTIPYRRDESGENGNEGEERKGSSKVIVHDFAEVEPDEISQAFDLMASQLKEKWRDLLGSGDGEDEEAEIEEEEEGKGQSMFARLKAISFGF